jgi:hypothetical protein
MTARRIIPAVSVLALCLGACFTAGVAIASSGSQVAGVPADGRSRTVILNPSTGEVVKPGTQAPAYMVILNPVTGQIVDPGTRASAHIIILDPVTGQIARVSS